MDQNSSIACLICDMEGFHGDNISHGGGVSSDEGATRNRKWAGAGYDSHTGVHFCDIASFLGQARTNQTIILLS